MRVVGSFSVLIICSGICSVPFHSKEWERERRQIDAAVLVFWNCSGTAGTLLRFLIYPHKTI